jgi:hypothetical protein
MRASFAVPIPKSKIKISGAQLPQAVKYMTNQVNTSGNRSGNTSRDLTRNKSHDGNNA